MSSISPSDQSKLEAFSKQLQAAIEDAEHGKQVNITPLQQQLKSLLGNKQIPPAVQQSLLAASQELKGMQGGQGNIQNLVSLQTQINALLGGEEGKGPGISGEDEIGKGSVG